jgi:hypothetical protein
VPSDDTVESVRARPRDSRVAFYYAYTLDSPAMIMRILEVGSQYLVGFRDSDDAPFDGSKTYKVALPQGNPAKAFWSLTLYDNQTRSMRKGVTGLARASPLRCSRVGAAGSIRPLFPG